MAHVAVSRSVLRIVLYPHRSRLIAAAICVAVSTEYSVSFNLNSRFPQVRLPLDCAGKWLQRKSHQAHTRHIDRHRLIASLRQPVRPLKVPRTDLPEISAGLDNTSSSACGSTGMPPKMNLG